MTCIHPARQVLSPIKTKLGNHRVILFVKERKLSSYTRKYKKYTHVEARAHGDDYWRRASNLHNEIIEHPSPAGARGVGGLR